MGRLAHELLQPWPLQTDHGMVHDAWSVPWTGYDLALKLADVPRDHHWLVVFLEHDWIIFPFIDYIGIIIPID